MLTRKKLVCFGLLLLLFLMIPQAAAASEVNWQITWEDNNTLSEKVTFPDSGINEQLSGWKYSNSADKVVLERKVKNWSAYEKLQDKLPVHIAIKNYVLIKIITFTIVPAKAEADTVIDKMSQLNGVDLKISVPGVIRDGSADEIVNGLTAVWHLKNIDELGTRGTMLLRVATFDGLILGIIMAVVGLIIITLAFWIKVRKTHKFIEQEYSLDNVHLPDEETEEEDEEDKY